MGRAIFSGFLSDAGRNATSSAAGAGTEVGVHWGSDFASWSDLLAAGRERARLVTPGSGYIVDPSTGLEGFCSLLAVATTPDTLLVYSEPARVATPVSALAPGLYGFQVGGADSGTHPGFERPWCGVLSSGTSGHPKVAVLAGDLLELVALHYDLAVYAPAFAGADVQCLATCLPLQFSAAFFMAVIPAMILRRDLVVFPAYDWRQAQQHAQRQRTAILAVPALTAAASLSAAAPVDMSRALLLLGGGYLTRQRVDLIAERFRGAEITNIYGTAETGALCLDRDPGFGLHVGRPIPGKPVWIDEPDATGVGRVATTGPDCRQFFWDGSRGLTAADPVVASTDYGHLGPDGNLYLDGRVDGGQKLAGQLIYPRAIERHILTLVGVADASVTVRHLDNGFERLAVRVVGEVGEGAVREHCSALNPLERPSVVECYSERSAADVYSAHGKL